MDYYTELHSTKKQELASAIVATDELRCAMFLFCNLASYHAFSPAHTPASARRSASLEEEHNRYKASEDRLRQVTAHRREAEVSALQKLVRNRDQDVANAAAHVAEMANRAALILAERRRPDSILGEELSAMIHFQTEGDADLQVGGCGRASKPLTEKRKLMHAHVCRMRELGFPSLSFGRRGAHKLGHTRPSHDESLVIRFIFVAGLPACRRWRRRNKNWLMQRPSSRVHAATSGSWRIDFLASSQQSSHKQRRTSCTPWVCACS